MEHSSFYLLDGIDHSQAHVNAEDSVIRSFDWCSTDAIIAVAKNLDSHLMISLSKQMNEEKRVIQEIANDIDL